MIGEVLTMSELKPCPFCGKRPGVHRSTFSEKYRIRCDQKGGCGAETASCGTKEQAIDAWNRRMGEGEKG